MIALEQSDNSPAENKDSSESIGDSRVLSADALREYLTPERLEELIKEYVEESFHYPEGLIPFFRAKIFETLQGTIGFFSGPAEHRLSWYLVNTFQHVSFRDVLHARTSIARNMLEKDWLYGLEREGEIVCIAGYRPFPGKMLDGRPVPEIRSVFTPKAFRNKGYAKAVLTPLIQRIQHDGLPQFMSTESEGMMKIARDLGFQELDEKTMRENFTEDFQKYLHMTMNLGYRVFVLFPKVNANTSSS